MASAEKEFLAFRGATGQRLTSGLLARITVAVRHPASQPGVVESFRRNPILDVG
jgi:hypothetical protein